jgi:hypothetical protein
MGDVLTTLLALVLLHGTVTIGPTSPVCSVDHPCEKAAVKVTLTFSRPGRVVRAVTDENGRYRVSLPAGAWKVRASAGMFMKPATITLPRVRTATRNFAIDTGIR